MSLIVLGCHRSGTSLVTRILNLMGAYVGPEEATIGSSEENPKGFWERQDVIACNNAILKRADCTWTDVWRWPDSTPKPEAADAEAQRVVHALEAQQPFVIKDPRLCLTLPHWLPALTSPVVVLVHRSPPDIARSLHTRNGLHPAFGIALWEVYMVSALNAVRELPVIRVEYDAMVDDPVAQTRQLFEKLQALAVTGLHQPDEAAVRAFVSAELKRSHAAADPDESLTGHQRTLAEICTGERPIPQSDLHAPETSREAIRAYLPLHASRAAQATLERVVHEIFLGRPPSNLQEDTIVAHVRALHEDRALLRGHLETLGDVIETVKRARRWRIGSAVAAALRRISLRSTADSVFTRSDAIMDWWRSRSNS